jgi:MFS family permease
MGRLFRVPFVRRYLLGQSLSVLGDTSLWLAMAIWVRELTGSNGQAGLTFFFMAAPSLAGPLWGTVVDRYRRRPILIGVNAAAGLMTLSLLFVHGVGQVWIIWVVMAGYGVSNSVLGGAQNGFLRTLVPDDLLGDAQGLLTTVREGLRLVSPLIGAGLFAVLGAHVVATIDAATFGVAAITTATIRVGEPAPLRIEQRLRTEVAAGWAHIRDTVRIRQVTIALTATCAVVGFTETGIIAVVTDGLHRPATWLGPFETLMGVGALVGGPTVAAAMRRLGEGRVSALGMIAFAAGSGLVIIPTTATVAMGAAIAGFGLPWVVAAANTLVQRLTPVHLQGRVSTTLDVLAGTPQSLSIAVGAGLIGLFGYQALMGAVGIVTLGSGLWLLSRREQRVSSGPALPPGSTIDAADALARLGPEPLIGSATENRR